MATYISDDPKLLDELFRKDGEGQLLVGYETGKEKPHAESSYMLYPANPDRQDPVYTFMALFSQQSIKAKYSAFVPNTRLEIYSFPKMTDVPAISGDISKKEYINQVLLPYIREKGLAPLISTNLRNVLFAQSRSDILMISGELPKLTTQQLDELVHFHQKQDELAARYDYNPVYKLPLHAVETSKGILFFSDTKMGREGLKSFYQQLSGNYFWVHGELGPVRQYNVNCLSDDICPLVDACYRKNPQSGKGEYDFDNAVFSKEAFRDRKQWKLAFETDMEPSASEFLRLPHVRQVKPEQFRIRNIGAALRFLDIVNQEFAEQAVRISFLNECEGISGLVGRVLMVTVHTDKNTSRLVGIEKRIFHLVSLVHISTI